MTDRIDSGSLRQVAKAERDAALADAARLRPSVTAENYIEAMLTYEDARHAAWQRYMATVLAIGDAA